MKSSWNFNICTINRTIYKDLIKFRATARYESVAVVDQNGPPDQDKQASRCYADRTNFLCPLSYSWYPRACFHVAYHHISHLEIFGELVNLLADRDSRVARGLSELLYPDSIAMLYILYS